MCGSVLRNESMGSKDELYKYEAQLADTMLIFCSAFMQVRCSVLQCVLQCVLRVAVCVAVRVAAS